MIRRTRGFLPLFMLVAMLVLVACDDGGSSSPADTDIDADMNESPSADGDLDFDSSEPEVNEEEAEEAQEAQAWKYLLDEPWTPSNIYHDTGYIQEVATHFTLDETEAAEAPFTAVASLANGAHYAATESTLYRLEEDGLTPVEIEGFTPPIISIEGGENDLFLATENQLWVIDGENNALVHTLENETIRKTKRCGDSITVQTENALYMKMLRDVAGVEDDFRFEVEGILDFTLDCNGQHLFAITETELITIVPLYNQQESIELPEAPTAIATGMIPMYQQAEDAPFVFNAPALFIATANAIYRLDKYEPVFEPETIFTVKGEDGLPSLPVKDFKIFDDPTIESTQAIASIWLLSFERGMAAYRADKGKDSGQDWHYYNSENWLAGLEVNDMALTSEGDILAATDKGVSLIERQEWTLRKKAALFDEITQARHLRMGYVATQCPLTERGNVETCSPVDDDNDGEWTALYVASQAFRYAVTGDTEAREAARVSMEALLKLESVTPIDGFFARSIILGDEECQRRIDIGPSVGEWHFTEDKELCWKGDTSSDEWVGHFLALPIYYDLCANGEEKAKIRETVTKILDYTIECGYCLRDLDGECTQHARFDPEFIHLVGVFGDAGLNGAMILGALRAGYHITGDARYQEAFDYLAGEEGENYQDYVRRIEEINLLTHTNHDSEEMSFLALFTLMRYETDPARMALWREGLDYLWQVQIPERNPEFNMIYAALTHADEYGLSDSIETLQKLPVNLVRWGVKNSHRTDIEINPKLDRHGEMQSMAVLSYDERQAERWAENPYLLDMRDSGFSECSGTFWLLPYWMGRYLGVIE